jgi:hypothetical protein
VCDCGGEWRCSTKYLEIAHAKYGVSGVGFSETHFRVCDFGDSADGLGCSTTFVEIAHMKMGVITVGLLETIVACAILGDSGGVQINA